MCIRDSFLVDRNRWTEEDDLVGDLFKKVAAKQIVVINKVDLVQDRATLLPLLQSLQDKFPDAELVPVSAEKSLNLDTLDKVISDSLPASPFYFDSEQVTDRSLRFLAAEILREKLMRQLGDELPYALTIQIEKFAEQNQLATVEATIFVEKEGQKRILIGNKGERLKRVGIDARRDMEEVFGTRVVLNTWVKVKSGWSDDERAMKSLGYDEY